MQRRLAGDDTYDDGSDDPDDDDDDGRNDDDHDGDNDNHDDDSDDLWVLWLFLGVYFHMHTFTTSTMSVRMQVHPDLITR